LYQLYNFMEIITQQVQIVQEVSDEPPEPPDISRNWFYRMVSCIATNLSVRAWGKDSPNFNCFCRKSFGTFCFIEFR
jgi:hypothetical protein